MTQQRPPTEVQIIRKHTMKRYVFYERVSVTRLQKSARGMDPVAEAFSVRRSGSLWLSLDLSHSLWLSLLRRRPSP